MDTDEIFKLFDIRGPYPRLVNERFAYALAKALTRKHKPKKVLVCCDTRESSPTLKEFLIHGFGNCNVAVYDLGEAPMPQFNFAMTRDNYDLGVMVTASHLSSEENGFKMIKPGPLPFNEIEVASLKEPVKVFLDEPITVPQLLAQKVTASEAYTAAILKIVGYEKPKIKVALDATRSAVLTTVMALFQKLDADFHLVNSHSSGNPLLEINRRALSRDVVDTQSDLGVIWDSDGDRVAFVDRQGTLIPMSFALGILAAHSLTSDKQTVAVDIRAGLVVRDLVNQAGGELVILPAWNNYIKFAIADDPTIAFGGETSGHFIFPDFFNIDDGILAALKFIRLFENGYIDEKLKELAKKYFELPEKNIPCQPDQSVAILEKLAQDYRRQDYLVSVVDGLTVFGPNFKFNLRQSVTEPLLRLNIESPDQKTAHEIEKQIEKHLIAK